MKPEALPKVLRAVSEFVAYVRKNEARTLVYSAWHDAADPLRFVHQIVCADADAHQGHSTSLAVQRFTALLYPEVQGQVEFGEYTQVASTEPR